MKQIDTRTKQGLGRNNNITAKIFDEYNTINVGDLFIAYFNRIPCWIKKNNIDCKKAVEWFLNNYKDNIRDSFYQKVYEGSAATSENIYYITCDDLLLHFDTRNDYVRLLFGKTDEAVIKEVVAGIDDCAVINKNEPEISLIVNKDWGLDIVTMPVIQPKLSIEDNYNDDLTAIHQTILKRLSCHNDKGLVLLYGKPGTGKTSYIRHLISKAGKKIVFLPPHLAQEITNPSIITLLIDNPDSIFVIEDAEKIIIEEG